MGNTVFLYRTKAADDRDCCAYIEPIRFECGHYFSSVGIKGACYSKSDFEPYENIDTFLTEEEYNKLLSIKKSIEELGYGITKGDERYQKGMEICKEYQTIIDKLKSDEGNDFYAEIIADEMNYMMSVYNLDEDDISDIYNNYSLDYMDRAIIGYVFEDAEELAYEEIDCYINTKELGFIMNYFDYEAFGRDLVNDNELYYELSDGRVVTLNY